MDGAIRRDCGGAGGQLAKLMAAIPQDCADHWPLIFGPWPNSTRLSLRALVMALRLLSPLSNHRSRLWLCSSSLVFLGWLQMPGLSLPTHCRLSDVLY